MNAYVHWTHISEHNIIIIITTYAMQKLFSALHYQRDYK